MISTHNSKVYYSGEYPKDHWAMQPVQLSKTHTVALATFKAFEYGVYLHPSDKRGCRCIAILQKKDNMESTFNRKYTSEEKIGLGLLVQLMTQVYEEIFPIAQAIFAGNNTQEFNELNGATTLGTPHEPSRLNAHIWGRGNPNQQYINGVKLDGPKPGTIFALRADGTEEGNNKPITWTPSKIRQTIVSLKLEIEKVKAPYEKMGLNVTT